ncbi:MAG: GNAT family N-acetyltransferase [Eubacteriales bacterium]
MKQLMMLHRMERIDEYPIPEGWTIRNWREGEIDLWTRICENGLIGPDSDHAAWKGAILGRENLVPERDIFFVCRKDDVPEATLTAYVHPDGLGDIHMVAAAPSIRGMNVGRVMLSYGMKKLDREMTYRPRLTELTTDDWRLPAIVGYLRGGFQPVEYDEGMFDRWKNICDELNIHGVEMLTERGEPTGVVL